MSNDHIFFEPRKKLFLTHTSFLITLRHFLSHLAMHSAHVRTVSRGLKAAVAQASNNVDGVHRHHARHNKNCFRRSWFHKKKALFPLLSALVGDRKSKSCTRFTASSRPKEMKVLLRTPPSLLNKPVKSKTLDRWLYHNIDFSETRHKLLLASSDLGGQSCCSQMATACKRNPKQMRDILVLRLSVKAPSRLQRLSEPLILLGCHAKTFLAAALFVCEHNLNIVAPDEPTMFGKWMRLALPLA